MGLATVDAVTAEGVVDEAVVAVISELGVGLAVVDVVTVGSVVDEALVAAETALASVSEVLPPLQAPTDSATATRTQYLTPERYQLQAADYEV